MSRRATKALTHAGGVVYRTRGSASRFLLVTAKRPPHEWVYPKGHIERGETPEETAVREVREESGVKAEVVAPLQDVRVVARGERQIIRFFLMRARGTARAREDRRVAWVKAEEGLERLSFREARSMLRKAVAALRAIVET